MDRTTRLGRSISSSKAQIENVQACPDTRNYQWYHPAFCRFLQAYKANNISIWAITTQVILMAISRIAELIRFSNVQNEPAESFVVRWQSQFYFPWTERDFIKYDLGPALWSNGFEDVKLYVYDCNRYPFTPGWIIEVCLIEG